MLTETLASDVMNEKVKVGDTIKIVKLIDVFVGNDYDGRIGVVEAIDSIGQLHGTWGGLAVVPEIDEYEILANP